MVAACVQAAGAGINKAPTFGVLNRIKMCVAALLSTVTQQLPGWKSVCCPVRENISFRPENIWLLLFSSAVWATVWTQEASIRLVWEVPSLPSCYCPLTLPLPLKHCRKHHTFSISNGLWCVQCVWMYPHCSPLISIRAAHDPSVFTIMEKAPTRAYYYRFHI